MHRPLIDCHTHIGVDPAFHVRGHFPYAQDFRGLVAQARSNGVQRLVTFPFVTYFGWGLGFPLRKWDAGFLGALALENRRMLEEIFDSNSDLARVALPLAIVDPARNQEAQVAALRELRERVSDLRAQDSGHDYSVSDPPAARRRALPWWTSRRSGMCRCLFIPASPRTMSGRNAATFWTSRRSAPDVRFCLAHSCRYHRASLGASRESGEYMVPAVRRMPFTVMPQSNLKIVAVPEERLETDYTRPEVVMKALKAYRTA